MEEKREDDAMESEQIKKVQKRMNKPYNNLDMEYLQTEPAYGKESTDEFYNKLRKYEGEVELYTKDGHPVLDKEGNEQYVQVKTPLWDNFGYLTRDLRFGNLNASDVLFCEIYLDLAHDCLALGCKCAFMISYSRVAHKTEISQSRGGFFRKMRNSIFANKTVTTTEGKDKGLMGGQKPEY